MSTVHKYDPEDIESLLLHKQFHELYPEEREFVLRHVENADEYESLRRTLFEVRDAGRNGEWLEPDPSIREELLATFAREEQRGFRVWLNTLFGSFTVPKVRWYRRPAVQLAFASLALIAGLVLFLDPGKRETTLAEKASEVAAPSDTTALAANEDLDTTTAFPPAPRVLAMAEQVSIEPAEVLVESDRATAPTQSDAPAMAEEAPAEESLSESKAMADAATVHSFNTATESTNDVITLNAAPTSANSAKLEVMEKEASFLWGNTAIAPVSMPVRESKSLYAALFTAH